MFWDAATGKPAGEPLRHEDPVIAASFSPDGRTVLTATAGEGEGGRAQLWDVTAGKRLGRPLPFLGEGLKGLRHGQSLPCSPGVSTAAFSPDGKTVLTAVEGGLRVWDAATRKPIGEPLRPPDDKSPFPTAAFGPDGRVILTARGSVLQLWDASAQKPIDAPLRCPGWEARFVGLAFSPDGRTFLTGGSDGIARLWRVPAPLDGEGEQIGRAHV